MSATGNQARRRFLSKALIDSSSKGSAVITGASSGIGAIYADQLASWGYDLILVARNRERLSTVAKRVREDTGRSVEIIVADLSDRGDLAHVEETLRTNASITLLVNNAGVGVPTPFLAADIGKIDQMIELNVTALVRLTYAVMPAFVARSKGAVINISSALGIAPELLNGVYGGTKAFVLAFGLSLHKEFSGRGIRIQTVVPGATATDFWDISATPLNGLPAEVVMDADEMVEAAIAGFELGETITIPSLPDVADWETYEAARQNLIPKLSLSCPAGRYMSAHQR
ncbi:SDR family oxidoreductase [Acidobacterium sp. S8]|uniref:SDR family NAD(P)-dependent oxidoreductase n=1 Tax=Acidobacterium sp. S8 TaxID=1641854 RepID=UPI001C203079|nr:SDR family oxidoreductase [Acidobacterium sp. S8]